MSVENKTLVDWILQTNGKTRLGTFKILQIMIVGVGRWLLIMILWETVLPTTL